MVSMARAAAVAITLFVAAVGPAAEARSDVAASPALSAAETYIAAYERLDLEALRGLYADDVDFVDQTSLGFPQPYIWSGRDAVLAGIANWKTTVSRLDYSISSMFEAAGRVVIIGTVDSVMERPDTAPVVFRFQIVTILTLEDGKVVEHRDYTNYPSARRVATAGQG